MRKIRWIVCFAAVAAMAVALCGCAGQNRSFGENEDNNKYSVGDASIKEKVETIRIDWVSGAIRFELKDQNTVDIAEEIKGDVEDNLRMRWRMDGTTLYIKFSEPTFKLLSFGDKTKSLTVTLPKDLVLKELEVDATSTKINSQELQAGKVAVDITSGELDLDCTADLLDVKATSGLIKTQCTAKEIRIDATSGKIDLTQRGEADSISMDVTSGNIKAALDRFNKLDISGTSSDVTVTLPKDTGFTADIDMTSGDFNSEIPVQMNKNDYIAGDGSAKIRIDVTSGDVTFLEAK